MATFKDIGLNPEIIESLEELGFETPTPIQEKSIPIILSSQRDLIALAQTGTGKTAAFSLPIIQQINREFQGLQVIVLCPIRELCLQITSDIKTFTKHSTGINVVPVYGGERIGNQINLLRGNAQIVVGTPGRVHDLIRRKVLKLGSIKWVVLDEADEMLDMGFKDDLDSILKETPKTKQTLLFSATMPDSVRKIAQKYMNNPEEISSGQKNVGADNVTHEFYSVHAKDRYEALRRILDSLPDVYGILFCRTKIETQEVASRLIRDHYMAEAIHGDVEQSFRTDIMNRFRKKQIQLLVATDVAARGIDVKDLTHIINYNLPDGNETYIHRSGRTGRAHKSGVAISIINTREIRRIREIEQKLGKIFVQKKIPMGEDICEKQLYNIIEKIKNLQIDEKQIEPYLADIYQKLEGLDREELIKRLVSTEFNYFLGLYQDAHDLNVGAEIIERRPMVNANFVKLKINFGKKNNFGVRELFGMVNGKRILKGIQIGKIDLYADHSVFEIEAKRVNEFMAQFKRTLFDGRPIMIMQMAGETPVSRNFDRPNRKPNNRSNRRFAGRGQRR